MKPTTIAALLCSSMFVAPALMADTFPVNAPIKQVTVFQNGGAIVTRSGTLQLPAGKHQIVLQNLHEDIQSKEYAPHATISGGAALLSGIKIKAQNSPDSASALQKNIKGKIKVIEGKLATVENEITANDMRLAFLRKIGSSPAEQSSLSDLEALQNAMNFIGSKAEETLSKTQALRIRKHELTQEKAALEREFSRSGKLRLDYQQAQLSVNNPSDNDVEFNFSYYVRDASWKMNVASSLVTSQEQLTISTTALVSQKTGENWENIELSLSNSRPSRHIGGIDVRSQFIEFTPENLGLQRYAIEQSPMAKSDFAGAVATDRVQTHSSYFDKKYSISGRSSILSTGETEQVNIQNHTSDAEIITRIVPFMDKTAYVYADTKMDNFLSVRNVKASLTRDGHFVGSGHWPNLEENTPLELPYGKNPNIEVDYVEQAPEDGSKGVFSKKSIEEKRFLIKVTNHGQVVAETIVYDRYPVSTHEDIKVTPLKNATTPFDRDMKNRPGVIQWKKSLKPGETWVIKHEYKVSYPSDKNIHQSER